MPNVDTHTNDMTDYYVKDVAWASIAGGGGNLGSSHARLASVESDLGRPLVVGDCAKR